MDKSKFNVSKNLNLFRHTDSIVSLKELEILSGKYLTAIYAWKNLYLKELYSCESQNGIQDVGIASQLLDIISFPEAK